MNSHDHGQRKGGANGARAPPVFWEKGSKNPLKFFFNMALAQFCNPRFHYPTPSLMTLHVVKVGQIIFIFMRNSKVRLWNFMVNQMKFSSVLHPNFPLQSIFDVL